MSIFVNTYQASFNLALCHIIFTLVSHEYICLQNSNFGHLFHFSCAPRVKC